MKIFMQETVEKYNMIACGDRIVCGVSGGADSVAMLCGMLELSEKLGFSVCVAHLNHMLRGEESLRDLSFVRELCKKIDVEFFEESVDVNTYAREKGESLELAARNVRYAFFDRVCKSWNANKIATAHNADDNFETVIMHLTRGCSLNGFGGIPPVRENIIRPLIETTREEIIDYLKFRNQDFVEDSTNAEKFCTRNTIRLDVIPTLKEINPRASKAVGNSSQMARDDEICLNELGESIAGDEVQISISKLHELPKALQRRVILHLARNAVKFTNYSLEFDHICDIINLTYNSDPSSRINLPCGLVAKRQYDLLCFDAEVSEKADITPKLLFAGEKVVFGECEISCEMQPNECKSGNDCFAIPVRLAESGITVRARQEGDTIKLKNRPCKTLKKLFIDEKIPKEDRESIPVLASVDGVIAVYGFGIDEKAEIIDKEDVFWVKIRRI